MRRAAWTRDRHVRILSDAFGHGNKVGVINGVGSDRVFVRVVSTEACDYVEHPKKLCTDVVAYHPADLRLI
jgi:hypothetical protein